MKIEYPASYDKSPRICSVLCPENPLEIGEEFNLTGYESNQTFFIQADGKLYFTLCHGGPSHVASDSLCDALNHPEKIIRRLQFNEDEKAFMRLLARNRLLWIVREKGGDLYAYFEKPKCHYDRFVPQSKYEYIPNCILPQITFENSPFDVAPYLESEEPK
jgi:hypothetical protein